MPVQIVIRCVFLNVQLLCIFFQQLFGSILTEDILHCNHFR